MMPIATVSIVALILAVAGPVAKPAVPATNTNVGNPNQKICETIKPIGSRLVTKRFCGTRAEWEDRRRQDREATESAQRGACVRNAGC